MKEKKRKADYEMDRKKKEEEAIKKMEEEKSW